jgi:hypothetical protein
VKLWFLPQAAVVAGEEGLVVVARLLLLPGRPRRQGVKEHHVAVFVFFVWLLRQFLPWRVAIPVLLRWPWRLCWKREFGCLQRWFHLGALL